MKKYNAPVCEMANIDTRDIMTVSGYGEEFSWNSPTSYTPASVDMQSGI